MEWSVVDDLVRLAGEFGPFLFAILFILVVTRTAHGYYRECSQRKDPPASDQEKATYRFYFILSVWCGVIAMTLSSGWWVYAQLRGTYVYQVAIVGLGDDEIIAADYFQRRAQRPSVPGAIALHDIYFLVVREEPFKVGDSFNFDYYKIPPAATGSETIGIPPKEISVKYAGNKNDTYKLTPDATAPKLTIVTENERAADGFLTADMINAPGGPVARSVVTRLIGGR